MDLCGMVPKSKMQEEWKDLMCYSHAKSKGSVKGAVQWLLNSTKFLAEEEEGTDGVQIYCWFYLSHWVYGSGS